ncbi:MAG: peptidase E [Actinomycetota bacterium]
MAAQQIVAAGGRTLGTPVDDFVLGLARGRRVCTVPTANMEQDESLVLFYDAFARKAECSRLVFNPWPPSDLRAFTLAQDVLVVPGGNTANMLAVWHVHGFDRIVREAWEQGVVLYGWSAGMIAWFEAGVTDSFGPQLEAMDCLGFLPGSACPHYDGEGLRRPRYQELVADGFPPGWAADDGVALHFAGTELAEAVTIRPAGRAYRVEPGSETPIEARLV